jgi:hypothetical protein
VSCCCPAKAVVHFLLHLPRVTGVMLAHAAGWQHAINSSRSHRISSCPAGVIKPRPAANSGIKGGLAAYTSLHGRLLLALITSSDCSCP